MEAVEEEMRIHLGFQGAEFRFAGKDTGLHHAGFGFARGFDREQDVVESDREQIEQDAGAEDERIVLGELRADSAKFVEAGQHSAKNASGDKPQGAGDGRADDMGEKKSRNARALKRRGHAGIPGGEAYERVQQAENRGNGYGLEPTEVAGNRQQVGQHPRQRNPSEEVEQKTPELGENWMHVRCQFLMPKPPKMATPLMMSFFGLATGVPSGFVAPCGGC